MDISAAASVNSNRPSGASVARGGRHQPPPRQTVFYEHPAEHFLEQALAQCQEPDLKPAQRWAIVTTRSLDGPRGAAERIRQALGSRCVGTISNIAAHSPRQDVIRIARDLEAWGAQGVVAVGGGSVCDAVKAARLCLGNEVTQADDIDRLRLGNVVRPPKLHSIMIPTTLSAGEFTPYAGVNDERGPRHEALLHAECPPSVVILDPSMTTATPFRLWFSTAIRSVDHAVETWCSPTRTPFGDATSLHALKLLVPALRRCQADPDDLQARSDCQVGAWLSIQGFAAGVTLGGSHGIGHALGGTADMPHGETSCVMLPHVLRFNASVDQARQDELCAAIGEPGRPLADIIAELVAALGMPRRLRDSAIPKDVLRAVAQEAMSDRCLKANARMFESQEEVLALLEQAW